MPLVKLNATDHHDALAYLEVAQINTGCDNTIPIMKMSPPSINNVDALETCSYVSGFSEKQQPQKTAVEFNKEAAQDLQIQQNCHELVEDR